MSFERRDRTREFQVIAAAGLKQWLPLRRRFLAYYD